MSNPNISLRPTKRRRKTKTDPMREGDVESLDAVTVEREMVDTGKGPKEMKKYVPVPEKEISPTQEGSARDHTMTNDVYFANDMDVDNNFGEEAVPAEQRKVRIHGIFKVPLNNVCLIFIIKRNHTILKRLSVVFLG